MCNVISADFNRIGKEQTNKPISKLNLNKLNLAIDLNGMFRLLSKILSNLLGKGKIFGTVPPEKQRQPAMRSTISAFISIIAFWLFLFFYQATVTNPILGTLFFTPSSFQFAALFSEFLTLTKQFFQSFFYFVLPFLKKFLKFSLSQDIQD